jgi:hypothetical protein
VGAMRQFLESRTQHNVLANNAQAVDSPLTIALLSWVKQTSYNSLAKILNTFITLSYIFANFSIHFVHRQKGNVKNIPKKSNKTNTLRIGNS